MAKGYCGSSTKVLMGFCLYGDYGTWKSSFCLESAKLKNEDGSPFKVLYIDPEFGSINAYLKNADENNEFDIQNVYVVYTQSLVEVNELIERAANNEDFYRFDDEGNETNEVYLDSDGKPFRPDMIVIDGLTILDMAREQSLIEFSKKRATVRAKNNELTGLAKEVTIEGAGMEWKDFNTKNRNGQNLILNLMASGKHFAVTARETDEKKAVIDSKGNRVSVPTGKKEIDGFKGIAYNCRTVLHMFIDDDGVVKALVEQKDRTLLKKQNEVLIEPSILDWQPVINKNKGAKNIKITNTMDASINKELEAIEKEAGKYDEDADDKSNSDENNLSTVEDYKAAIAQAIKVLPQVEKSKRQSAVLEAGLPKAYQNITDIDELKKYYEIVS